MHSLKTLNEIDRAILSSWDLDHIVEVLIQRLPDLVPYEAVGISVVNLDKTGSTKTYIAGVRGSLRVEDGEITSDELKNLAANGESTAKNFFPRTCCHSSLRA